jgi:hypothetical protein
MNDREFTAGGSTRQSRNRYDLLTVVMHEFGHTLGMDDLSDTHNDLMDEHLQPGMRRLPNSQVLATPATQQGEPTIALIGAFGNPGRPVPLQQAPPISPTVSWDTYNPAKRFNAKRRGR